MKHCAVQMSKNVFRCKKTWLWCQIITSLMFSFQCDAKILLIVNHITNTAFVKIVVISFSLTLSCSRAVKPINASSNNY